MNPSKLICLLLLMAVLLTETGCASVTNQRVGNSIVGELDNKDLQFIDLTSFDKSLAHRLSHHAQDVTVVFYNRLTPSQLPDRLQHWIGAVESQGGHVKVIPPPSPPGAVVAKNPFLLISGLVSLWSTKKAYAEILRREDLKSAKQYDATLMLKQGEAGEVFLDKIIFKRRNT